MRLGIFCTPFDHSTSGIIVGVYVHSDDVLNKYRSGEYKGFSVGGQAKWENV